MSSAAPVAIISGVALGSALFMPSLSVPALMVVVP